MVELSENNAVKIENALQKGADALEATNAELAAELLSVREIITKLLDAVEGGEKEKPQGAPANPFA
jgi:hypothetical protein